MRGGAYSNKFKAVQEQELKELKEEHKKELRKKKEQERNIIKETNRRRRYLAQKRKLAENEELKRRDEILNDRKDRHIEATRRFQKAHVVKSRISSRNKLGAFPLQDGFYNIRGHIVEIKDGRRIPTSSVQDKETSMKNALKPNDSKLVKFPSESHVNSTKNALYSGKSYLLHHLSDLVGEQDKIVIPKDTNCDVKDDSNMCHEETEKVTEQEKDDGKRFEDEEPEIVAHADDQKVLVSDVSLSSTDSLEMNDSMASRQATMTPKSSLKNRKTSTGSDKQKRRVKFNSSIEFNDGFVWMLKDNEQKPASSVLHNGINLTGPSALAAKNIPLYTREEKEVNKVGNVSFGNINNYGNTSFSTSLPRNNDYSYPDSVDLSVTPAIRTGKVSKKILAEEKANKMESTKFCDAEDSHAENSSSTEFSLADSLEVISKRKEDFDTQISNPLHNNREISPADIDASQSSIPASENTRTHAVVTDVAEENPTQQLQRHFPVSYDDKFHAAPSELDKRVDGRQNGDLFDGNGNYGSLRGHKVPISYAPEAYAYGPFATQNAPSSNILTSNTRQTAYQIPASFEHEIIRSHSQATNGYSSPAFPDNENLHARENENTYSHSSHRRDNFVHVKGNTYLPERQSLQNNAQSHQDILQYDLHTKYTAADDFGAPRVTQHQHIPNDAIYHNNGLSSIYYHPQDPNRTVPSSVTGTGYHGFTNHEPPHDELIRPGPSDYNGNIPQGNIPYITGNRQNVPDNRTINRDNSLRDPRGTSFAPESSSITNNNFVSQSAKNSAFVPNREDAYEIAPHTSGYVTAPYPTVPHTSVSAIDLDHVLNKKSKSNTQRNHGTVEEDGYDDDDDIISNVRKSMAELKFNSKWESNFKDGANLNKPINAKDTKEFSRPTNKAKIGNSGVVDDVKEDIKEQSKIDKEVSRKSNIPIRNNSTSDSNRDKNGGTAQRKGLVPHPPTGPKSRVFPRKRQPNENVIKRSSPMKAVDPSIGKPSNLQRTEQRRRDVEPATHQRNTDNANQYNSKIHANYDNYTPSQHYNNAYGRNNYAESSPGYIGESKPGYYRTDVPTFVGENGPINDKIISKEQKSETFDKTPTDDEINELWYDVRNCLQTKPTKKASSDSVFISSPWKQQQRTWSGSKKFKSKQSNYENGFSSPGYPNSTHPGRLGSNLPLRRYGSYDNLRRENSLDNLAGNVKQRGKSAVLPWRSRSKITPSVQAFTLKKTSRNPVPTQSKFTPVVSNSRNDDMSESLASFLALEAMCQHESLSPHQTSAVVRASTSAYQGLKEESKRENRSPTTFSESRRQEPSALSIEERKVLESLERLNSRLREKEELHSRQDASKKWNNALTSNGQISVTRENNTKRHPTARKPDLHEHNTRRYQIEN